MILKIRNRGSFTGTVNLRGICHEVGESADGLVVTQSPHASFFSLYQSAGGVTIRINDPSFKLNGTEARTSKIRPGDIIENEKLSFTLYPVDREVRSLALSGLSLQQLKSSMSKKRIKLEHRLSNIVEHSYLYSNRPVVIGSGNEADIVIDLPDIKKRHMRVWVEDDFPVAEPLEGSISMYDKMLGKPTRITSPGSVRLNPGMMEIKFLF